MSFLMSAASPPEAVVLLNAVAQAEGAALDTWLTLLHTTLQQLPATAPKSHYAALMQLITDLTRRREEAELLANPAHRAGIERVGEHFARKAQSGFSPYGLPE